MTGRRLEDPRGWLWLVVLTVVGCSSPRPQLGGETHWLRSCWSDDECGDALSCICGSCTRTCHEDDSCEGGRPAACYEQDSPLLLQRCAGNSPDVHAAAGVCLALCDSDDQCSDDKRCEQGACVPAESSADAGAALGGSSGPAEPGRTISDFDDVQADVPADGEVTLPKLSTTIDGQGAQSLVGDWKAQGCPPPSEDAPRHPTCPELVITADGSGVVSGYVQYSNGPPLEPFPPASDPDVGYPPGLSVSEVNELRYSAAGIAYPLRDARYENGVLTFLWSPNDLFQGWCALQRPQRWTIDDHTFYFCGPQDPDQLAALDPVKRSLCVSASLGPWCPAPDGTQLPCPCVEPDNPDCTVAVCHCDSRGCEAETRWLASKAEFVVDGDTMIGGWDSSTNTVASYSYLPMVREAQ